MKSPYYSDLKMRLAILAGRHRHAIGGEWDANGARQEEFLKSVGLRPEHRFLDIGCGALRLGARLAAYLEPGNYYGTDLQKPLLDVGDRKEIVKAGLADRLPRENLIHDQSFSFEGAPRGVEFAFAQSVFSHLPLNDLMVCLSSLKAKAVCREFYFTVFLVPTRSDWMAPHPQRDGVVTVPDADPYHYVAEDILYACQSAGAQGEIIGEWGHSRGQQMAVARF